MTAIGFATAVMPLGTAIALFSTLAHALMIVMLLLLEGAVYDVAASVLGIAIGLGLGVAIIAAVRPVIARIGFPLHIALSPTSMVFAFSLGFLFTLITIGVAAWIVSHMTVAAALRDLPEPPQPQHVFAICLPPCRFSLMKIGTAGANKPQPPK